MTEHGGPAPDAPRRPHLDFFLSYVPADAPWARWVGWTLETAGYRVLLQEWDSVPGSNWHRQVHEAVQLADRTIALLSPDYLSSSSAAREWSAVWVTDVDGAARRLVPIRVAACQASGLLGAIVPCDLFGLDESSAREKLVREMAVLRAGRARPASAPEFPALPRVEFPEPSGLNQELISPRPSPRRLRTEQVARLPHGDRIGRLSRSTWVGALSFGPTPRLLASGSDDSLTRLWNLSDPRHPVQLAQLADHDGWVRAVAFSPDGQQLVAGGAGGVMVARDVRLPSVPGVPRRLGGHRAMVWAAAFSPDSRLLATADDEGTVLLWSLIEPATVPRQVGAIRVPGLQVGALVFSPDGRTLVTGVADGIVRLWRLRGPDQATGDLSIDDEPLLLTDHREGVWAVALSPSGDLLATGSDDGSVRLWELSTDGRPARVAAIDNHHRWVRAVTFSADGRLLAIAGNGGRARLWDVHDPRMPTPSTVIEGLGGKVLAAAFAPARDGEPELLAFGCADGFVRIYAVMAEAGP